MRIGFLLLSGGKSTRMGQPKALVPWRGRPLMEWSAAAGAALEEKLFSVNDEAIPTPAGFRRVADLVPGCGPLSGLHAGLCASACDALAVLPCDAPCAGAQLIEFLCENFTPGLDALVLRDWEGRVHPLLGIYHKNCLDVMADCLKRGDYKLLLMLMRLNAAIVCPPATLGRRLFFNVNCPQDLIDL